MSDSELEFSLESSKNPSPVKKKDVKPVKADSASDEDSEDDYEEDSDVYEVEDILGHKIVNNKTYYHVKWKGYPIEEATWEIESNLNCDQILNKYLKSYENYIDSAQLPGKPIPIPKRVLKIKKSKDDEIVYVVQYKDGKTADVTSESMKKLNPKLAIRFLEDSIYYNAK